LKCDQCQKVGKPLTAVQTLQCIKVNKCSNIQYTYTKPTLYTLNLLYIWWTW